jgi:hypothetical protein
LEPKIRLNLEAALSLSGSNTSVKKEGKKPSLNSKLEEKALFFLKISPLLCEQTTVGVAMCEIKLSILNRVDKGISANVL